ncbi:hypothetical protein [Tenacibaculum aestuariivivum]|uniref:hypothetical protein n=1 Tax=Tenacibaculum aestuariivivum TaxID=2006131 RepID=UPI003AB9117D
MNLRNLSILLFLFMSVQLFSQTIELTKENICRGAAISVVGNIKPFVDRGFSKLEIIENGKRLVKNSIKDAPAKAYDLLKAKKSSNEAIEILYNDFMKLDNNIISKFLLKPNTDDEDYYDEEDE